MDVCLLDSRQGQEKTKNQEGGAGERESERDEQDSCRLYSHSTWASILLGLQRLHATLPTSILFGFRV